MKDGRTATRLLGKGPGLDIMAHVYKKGWCKASNVAKDMGLHTSTTVKYLSGLYESGLLLRRRTRSKTKKVYEYMVPEPVLDLRIDLREDGVKRPLTASAVYLSILARLMQKTSKVLGHLPDGLIPDHLTEAIGQKSTTIVMSMLTGPEGIGPCKNIDISGPLKGTSRAKLERGLLGSIEVLLEYLEEQIGEEGTSDLVASVSQLFLKQNVDVIRGKRLLDNLPGRYFKMELN